jgi:hypothetical protein
MGKRSEFTRRPHDAYQTIDPRAVRALLPYVRRSSTFIEPCCGNGHLADELERSGLRCVGRGDILDGATSDALSTYQFNADMIITNPPWTRRLLHPLILHFQKYRPTWLLFDSDWAFNKHASPYLEQCSDIVAVGRLRWIEGTTNTGKDNVSWYKFSHKHAGGPAFMEGNDNGPDNHHEKPSDLIERFIYLRNMRTKADSQFAEFRRAEFEGPMNEIEGKLLDILEKTGSESIRAKSGTAFKKTSVSVTTADGAEFRRHVIGLEAWELVDWRPNKTAVNELIDNGEALPPGLNRSTFQTINVRSATDKGDKS